MPEPLYKKVKAQIVEALQRGQWRYGGALPSEERLAAQYGVSVGTMRRALGELAQENILQRRQGQGTFVATHTRDYMLNLFFQIHDAQGRKELPQAQLLSFARTRADARTAQLLELRAGTPVFAIENLLRLEGEPVLLDLIWLPQALFPDLNEQIMSERDTTIYGLYQMRYGISVVKTVEKIGAVLADERVRRRLALPDPAAVLKIVRTAYSYKDQPVDTRVRYVSTRTHHYLSILGRREGGTQDASQ